MGSWTPGAGMAAWNPLGSPFGLARQGRPQMDHPLATLARGFQPPWTSTDLPLRVQTLLHQVVATMTLQGLANRHMFLVALRLLKKKAEREKQLGQ